MRRSFLLVVGLLVSACGSSSSSADGGTATDAGGGGCPFAPPAEGDPCDVAQVCGYLACDDVGVVRATCDGTSFHVATEACAPFDCRGDTCDVGQVCIINVGGAVIPFCTLPMAGPLTCQTVCGGPCVAIDGPADPPLRFQCNTCTSGMCP
ncbi:MAG: hypothetical protein H6719_20150 [Sandaracinaceae bacterium]|nr:hypothetical protein [Sandaracinaceae bacterium]